MLLVLMYHRVGLGKHANSLRCFEEHFRFLRDHYPLVLPGEPLARGETSLCLTFDDATFDFYHYLFPLLHKFEIRSVLAVPTRYILESTSLSPKTRLQVPYALAMQDGIFDTQAPFCTWSELREMVASHRVEIASHSHMHPNLTFPFVDLEREVVLSKRLLEDNLSRKMTSFIYPFGRVTPKVHAYVAQHYRFAFRIGSAMNWGWGKGEKPLCRVIGDQMETPRGPLTPWKRLGYLLKGLWIE